MYIDLNEDDFELNNDPIQKLNSVDSESIIKVNIVLVTSFSN